MVITWLCIHISYNVFWLLAIGHFTSADDSWWCPRLSMKECDWPALSLYLNSMGCAEWDLWCSNSATALSIEWRLFVPLCIVSWCIVTPLIFTFAQDVFHSIALDILPAFSLNNSRPTDVAVHTCVCFTCFKGRNSCTIKHTAAENLHVYVRVARLSLTSMGGL